MTLFGGARLDQWTAYDATSGEVGNEAAFDDARDDAISPQVALIWHPLTGTYVRSSISRAFRAPTVYELFSTSQMTYTYHNNPDLSPETTWTYEVGVDQYLSDRRVKLSATGFFTQADDLIGNYIVDTDVYKENIGEAEIKGLELGISAAPIDWLEVWANYTVTESEVVKNERNPNAVGKHLTYYPAQTFNTGLDVSCGRFKGSVMGAYIGRLYVNDQNDDLEGVYGSYSKRWVWDLKLSCHIFKKVECVFSVNNILDEEYYIYSLAPGRSYMFEIKWDLNV